MLSPRARLSHLPGLVLGALLLTLTGCRTQRFPGPMESLVKPLPEGEVPAPPYGPQEIVVYRLSDPVLVRQAGAASAYPLPVYSKRERVMSGASVQCAAGGRCEILWPQDASSVLLFDEAWVDLGEPSRDEPMVVFRRVTRARLILTPEDAVGLVGGAILRGDPEEKSGPYLLEQLREDLLLVTNQSKRACTVEFRDVELLLSPGERVRIALLGAGGTPAPRDPAEERVVVSGREVRLVGEARIEGAEVVAGARGATLEDGGVTVRLADGERALLEVYGAPVTATPEPLPEPPPADPAASAPEGGDLSAPEGGDLSAPEGGDLSAPEGGDLDPAGEPAPESADDPAPDPGDDPGDELGDAPVPPNDAPDDDSELEPVETPAPAEDPPASGDDPDSPQARL